MPSHTLIINARAHAPARVSKYERFFLKSPAFYEKKFGLIRNFDVML